MTKKLITILGITGMQGGSVASRFLFHAEWRVRGLVNTQSRDHDDLEAFKAAFQGTHAIFAVTDWATCYYRVVENKALQEKAKSTGMSMEEYAGDLEKMQSINIATAATDRKVLETLEIFVFSTLAAVQRISGGKYKHAYEFDSKASAEHYMREQLPELRTRLSTVTMGIFQETWKDIPAFRPHKQPDGTFEYVRLKTSGLHQENPEVVATRDTCAFVEALILHQPAGTDVLGASEIITKPDYAALWGRTLGVEATVRDVKEEGYKATIVDDVRFFAEYGYAGGNPRVKTPTELGIKTTSLE
ncbi:hypothetical protein PTT_11202 [Pyrenophora teres f. teres 0-1]|uniref:NmrA-like domain-containing protein n=1 Tax=Pyrenophora teres f. teres (strain 0-1) TaxID=861557 RepID=E3RQZ9_PYRTT|nr:hypothetical protein PTT_11202 [Pyrenophora teres f. teres 0-1]